ncbi:hypothetical protein HN51_062511, partial [Arachis hypogaea]
QHDYKRKKEYMDLPTFELSTTVYATNNQFSSNNELEKGGYGSGALANGTKIAIKRLSKNSNQGLQEFKTEV